jgi:DNA-binding response OmpR family regulator
MRLNGRKLNINGRIIGLTPKESEFVKLLIEKINTYVPIDDLYVALYEGEAGDWYKDSLQERQCIYSLLGILRKKLPEDYFKGNAKKGYMLSGSVMTSQSIKMSLHRSR